MRTSTLAVGTLACSSCDAPVALAGAVVSPSAPLSCPFCLHRAPVRDFLSLTQPTRSARVTVRLIARKRALAACDGRQAMERRHRVLSFGSAAALAHAGIVAWILVDGLTGECSASR